MLVEFKSRRATAAPPSDNPEPVQRIRDRRVAILMGVYNGAQWLPDQLYSIRNQTHRDWTLIVSDDGSSDTSLDIIECFARCNAQNEVRILEGPRKGFAENFLSLVRRVDADTPYVAFADQDDSWLPEKLERGLEALAALPDDTPALYCGRTWICSPRLRRMRASKHFKSTPCFENAIVQSIGGGNTMILNNAALRLLHQNLKGNFSVASHDWWAYQIVSGAGGEVIYDTEPMVLYRQHDNNVIGANESIFAVFVRLMMVLSGKYQSWNEENIQALYRAHTTMTPGNASILRTFKTARRTPFLRRLRMLSRSGIHHQTRLGNAGFWLAAVLGRV